MTIKTDNDEAFFYQYQEGILPESQRAEVEKFLSLHPELAEEMMLYDSNLKMPQQQEVFEGKEELIRELMRRDIEVARLKKGYSVKGGGSKKEYVTSSGSSTK